MPRYYQVYKSLLDRIQTGQFTTGDSLPSERQLTKEYSVSRITIVKALDKLEQDGLIDRQQGRGTFVQNPNDSNDDEPLSIAFLPGVFHHPYLYSVLMGIAHHASQNHVHLQVMGTYENSHEETRYVEEVLDRGIDGLIVYPHSGYENIDLYRNLQADRFPIVMVDRYYPQVQTDRVTFNDEEAGYQLTKRLLQRGHRRIAIIPHYEVEATSVRDRLRGYRRALTEAGIPYDEDLIWLDVYASFDPLHEHPQVNFTQNLQARLNTERPSALIAINQDVLERLIYDLMLLKTDRMRVAIEASTTATLDDDREPELASFSHRTRPEYNGHNVTLAVHSGERLGQRAAELLIGRLRGKADDSPQSVTVPMEIT